MIIKNEEMIIDIPKAREPYVIRELLVVSPIPMPMIRIRTPTMT
jgi:hypothetical protein